MKLTREDIKKYGTEEEVLFLQENKWYDKRIHGWDFDPNSSSFLTHIPKKQREEQKLKLQQKLKEYSKYEPGFYRVQAFSGGVLVVTRADSKLDALKQYNNKTHTADMGLSDEELLNLLDDIDVIKGISDATKEDIMKYGTKEEIEFLLEALTPAGEFTRVLSIFRERMLKDPNLKTKYQAELAEIDNQFKNNTFTKWVAQNPEAKRIYDLFKQEAVGKIYQGAFATTR